MYKILLDLPAHMSELDVALFGDALADLSSAQAAMRHENNHQSPWVLEWWLEALPDKTEIKSRLALINEIQRFDLPDLCWRIEKVPSDTNWLEECYQQFPPFNVGPFFIYGSHYEKQVPDGLIGLQIDAATAFGSGEHGTTKGCLQAMLDLKGAGQCPWNILDMGTGSGILAVAAWKLWKTPILAVDIDTEAVHVSEKHRDLNDVPAGATQMRCVVGDGFASKDTQDKKPYDLIIANILSSALLEMREELISVLDENGYVILSGILNEQAQSVITAYEQVGLSLKKTYEIGDWTSLVMKK